MEDLLSSPHPFIQLLHDSLHLAYENNITCINVPKNGEKGLKGIVTNEDVYNAYPHPDTAIDIPLTSHHIKNLFLYSI